MESSEVKSLITFQLKHHKTKPGLHILFIETFKAHIGSQDAYRLQAIIAEYKEHLLQAQRDQQKISIVIDLTSVESVSPPVLVDATLQMLALEDLVRHNVNKMSIIIDSMPVRLLAQAVAAVHPNVVDTIYVDTVQQGLHHIYQ